MTSNHIHMEDDKHSYMGHFFNSIKINYLTPNEALKLMRSKPNTDLIIPTYTINIFMDISI